MSLAYSEDWVVGPISTLFYTRFYEPEGPPKGLLLLIHGFIEHIGRFDHVASEWRARGFAVFAYDQRGFGRTATDPKKSPRSVYGKFTAPRQLDDIEFFLAHARSKVVEGLPVFLFGHSMGGGEVLSFCANMESIRDSKVVDGIAGVIASSPFIGQAKPMPKMKRAVLTQISKLLGSVQFPASVDPNALSSDKTVGEAFVKDPLVQQHACLRGLRGMFDRGDKLHQSYFHGWPQTLPLLVVHGDEDGGASFKLSKEFFDKLDAEDKTFSPYQGGRHELHNEPAYKEKVLDECISWAEKRPARAPIPKEAAAAAAAALEPVAEEDDEASHYDEMVASPPTIQDELPEPVAEEAKHEPAVEAQHEPATVVAKETAAAAVVSTA